MSRQKGTPKTGGRQKGTPNRASFQAKEIINTLLSGYMGESHKGEDGRKLTDIERDLESLTPAERVKAYSQLLGYVAPKQQAITIEEQTKIEEEALTNWLTEAPQEAIDAIAEKILILQAKNRQEAAS